MSVSVELATIILHTECFGHYLPNMPDACDQCDLKTFCEPETKRREMGLEPWPGMYMQDG